MSKRMTEMLICTVKRAAVLLLCLFMLSLLLDIPAKLHNQLSHKENVNHSISGHSHSNNDNIINCSVCVHLQSVSQLFLFISVSFLLSAITAVMISSLFASPKAANQSLIILKTRMNH